jgi:hypothetical protein
LILEILQNAGGGGGYPDFRRLLATLRAIMNYDGGA